jgi:hypothetical protein
MGVRGVDMSDFQIDDNKTYYEAICWGEHKNVHFWFEVLYQHWHNTNY